MSPPPYRLRAELYCHSADVRGVCVAPSGARAVTASRDCTVALWDIDPAKSGAPSAPFCVLRGHSHFVNSVVFVDESTLVSASSDRTCRVWSVTGSSTGVELNVLQGHTDAVCHVALIPGTRSVVSSSWDMTSRVWDCDTGECLQVLSGHTAAVWAAHPLHDNRVVTVAADKTVRLWSGVLGGSVRETVSSQLSNPHTDVVRSIAAGPENGFVTVSNDSMLVQWAAQPHGGYSPCALAKDLHDGSFIYSVDGMNAADVDSACFFVSGGEDNAVRVTRCDPVASSLTCMQTLMHPGSVWCVAMCANGDVLTGCSDGVARLFTRDSSLTAPASVLEKFEETLSHRQVNTKVIGGVDVTKLPLAREALSVPGAKDGENKIVKTDAGAAEVHMWSASEHKWVKIGDVVDGPGGGRSMGGGEVNGKAYDFVFDVDLGQGGANAKLGYNRGENPYIAAQRFLDDNEVNQDFLDEVARFVESNVPQDALQETSSAASDPLTGGSRYIPGGSNPSGRSGAATVPSVSIPSPNLVSPRKYLPHSSGVIIYSTSDQVDKIQAKLKEMSDSLPAASESLALSNDELARLSTGLLQKIRAKPANTSLIVEDDICEIIGRTLKWPTANVLPALDVARLALVHPSCGSYFFGRRNGSVLDDVLGHMTQPNAPVPVLILACRFLCNMFSNRVVASIALRRCDEVLKSAQVVSKCANKKARETGASLLLNYAVAMLESKCGVSDRMLPLQCCLDLLSRGEADEEVLYRLLIALGTLMCGGSEFVQLGQERGAVAVAASASKVSARLQQIAHEVSSLGNA